MLESKINHLQFYDDELTEMRIQDKLSKLAASDEVLQGDFLHAYQFASGFLTGSSFEGNPSCKAAMNAIVYNSLTAYQFVRPYNFFNTAKITIAT